MARRDLEQSGSDQKHAAQRPVTVAALRPLLEQARAGLLSLFIHRDRLWAVTVSPERCEADPGGRRRTGGRGGRPPARRPGHPPPGPWHGARGGHRALDAAHRGCPGRGTRPGAAPRPPGRHHPLELAGLAPLAPGARHPRSGGDGRAVGDVLGPAVGHGRRREGRRRRRPARRRPGRTGTRASHERGARRRAGVGHLRHTGTGRVATGEQLRSALARATIVHVAAHGIHQDESPLFSSVVMGDGPVFAHEFQRSGVGAEHVVLSSCEVGRTHVRVGDEALGLTASLLATGVRSVVAAVGPGRRRGRARRDDGLPPGARAGPRRRRGARDRERGSRGGASVLCLRRRLGAVAGAGRRPPEPTDAVR